MFPEFSVESILSHEDEHWIVEHPILEAAFVAAADTDALLKHGFNRSPLQPMAASFPLHSQGLPGLTLQDLRLSHAGTPKMDDL